MKKRPEESLRSKPGPPRSPSEGQTLFQNAVFAYQARRFDDARKWLRLLLDLEPKHFDGLLLAGTLAGMSGVPHEAVELLQRASLVQPRNPMARANLANALYEVGRFEDALASADAALRLKSEYAEAYLARGNALRSLGQPEAAVASYDRAIALAPNFVQAYNNRGNALKLLGRLEEALQSYERAVEIAPSLAELHHNRGNALAECDRFDEAIQSYEKAIALDPAYAEAFNHRGVAFAEMGRWEEALESFRSAAGTQPDYAEAHTHCGIALRKLGRPADALASFDRAVAANARDADAHNGRGLALHDLGDLSAALSAFDRAREIQPTHTDAHKNLGITLHELEQPAAALESLDRALALQPDFPEALLERGAALRSLKRLEEALESYDHAIEARPNYAEAFGGRGTTLREMGRIGAALASFDRAIELKRDYAEAYWNKCLTLLASGNFQEGWPLIEWRWRSERVRRVLRKGEARYARDWNGEQLAGPLLVLPEQGIGDEIFYSGMLNDLAALALTVTVCLDKRLIPLYRRSFPGFEFEAESGLALDRHFEAQTFLPSLGRFFRRDPGALVNVRVPYLFAEHARVDRMRSMLRPAGGMVCGISWISASRVGDDKSATLADLRPMLLEPGYTFVDLQYGDTEAERLTLQRQTGVEVRKIDEIDNYTDIDGLAALVGACDVVVTVSNTTAHLAAALGKPVLVLLSRSAGLLWYWHLDRSDSPWYPTATLFRQQRPGDWSGVIEHVRDHLRSLRTR